MRRAVVARRTRDWAPHSRLFIGQEAAEWVLSYEARQLERTADALGVELGPRDWVNAVAGQSIFHQSQFTLLLHDFERRGNNLGFAYFHGRPGTPGMPEFDACFDTMRRRHEEIDRVQVTNREMEELVRGDRHGAGEGAPHPDRDRRRDVPAALARRRRGARGARSSCPSPPSSSARSRRTASAGARGSEPKLIKGPDVLLSVAERLRDRVPELVLPAHRARRAATSGRASSGSGSRTGTRSSTTSTRSRRAYEAIDVCVVASRDEGGPRAVLESMATGVPLVTTRVGQAADLVEHGVNGWMVDVEDVEASGRLDRACRRGAVG